MRAGPGGGKGHGVKGQADVLEAVCVSLCCVVYVWVCLWCRCVFVVCMYLVCGDDSKVNALHKYLH